jgi:hypothetical protein
MATATGNGNGKNWVCFLRVLRLGIGASDYIRGVNLIISIGFVL